MLAKSLSFLAGADAAGIVLGARVPIILTSRADSVTDAARLLRRRGAGRRRRGARPRQGGGVSHDRRNPRPQRRLVEHQVLALRRRAATSSSCSLRGQVEGLYTAPRFVAKDAAGRRSSARRPGTRASTLGHDGALDHLVDFLREQLRRAPARRRSATASCTAGSSTRSRCASTPRVLAALEKLRPARAAAPAAQPGADPASLLERAPELPQVACFDTAFHRAQPRGGAGVRAAASDHRARRAALRLPRPVLRVHRRGAAAVRRAGRARARTVVLHLGNGASMCAMAGGRSVASTMGFTAVDGLPMGTRCGTLDPGVILYLMDELRHGRARHREADLPAVGAARRVGHLERHAHAARRATTPRAKLADRPVRLPHRARARLAGRGARRARRARLHRRHRREQRGRSASASAATPAGSASSSIATANAQRRPAHQHAGEPRRRRG